MPTAVYGNGSHNHLIGTNGADDMRGLGGDDTLNGSGGNDTMRGGADNDVYITDGGDTLIELANQGIDEVRASVSWTLANHFENLTLTGTSNLNGSGNAASNLIAGNAGNNVLNGGAGIDTFQMTREAGSMLLTEANLNTGVATGHGTDTLLNFENVRGTDFTDYITGNAGSNLLDGAGGHDEIFITAGTDTIWGGDGADAVRFDHVGSAVLNLASNSYSVSGAGQGTVQSVSHAVGGAGDDHFTGNLDSNNLSGGAGSDTLIGGGGNDNLCGGAGSDRLVADAGSDTLMGNSDWTGGTVDDAADIFEIKPGAGAVTITDFQVGVDKIDLSAFGFDANGHSDEWSASGSANPQDTVLQLTHINGAVVCISLQGQAQGRGDGLTMADFIGGSPALLPPPPPGVVPGGNGVSDVFVVDPWDIIGNHGGVLDIVGFEDGLDVIDLRPLDLNGGAYWGGWFYDYGPNDQTRLEFWGLNNEFFAVNLVGHHYNQADASDFIL